MYDAARTFLRNIMIHDRNITDEMIITYWSGINPARFILNQEITDYLVGLERQVTKYKDDQGAELKGMRTWAEEQVSILNDMFYPFLQLED